MNLKMEKFCELYVQSGNATDAAKKAGYSARTAYSQGQRLLKNVDIQKYLGALMETGKAERIANGQEILEFYTSIMRSDDMPCALRMRAAENLGKRYGLDRQEQESGSRELDMFIASLDAYTAAATAIKEHRGGDEN